MPKVIGVVNEKGGAGKTTTASNLGCALAELGHRVLLIDADPQGSLRDWSAANDEASGPTVIAIDRAPALIKETRRAGQGYDYVIIDGAPQASDLAAATVRVADAVLVPVQPSPYDVWAAGSDSDQSADSWHDARWRDQRGTGWLRTAHSQHIPVPTRCVRDECGQRPECADVARRRTSSQRSASSCDGGPCMALLKSGRPTGRTAEHVKAAKQAVAEHDAEVRLNVIMRSSEYKRIKQAALDRDMTVSDLVREAIAAHLLK